MPGQSGMLCPTSLYVRSAPESDMDVIEQQDCSMLDWTSAANGALLLRLEAPRARVRTEPRGWLTLAGSRWCDDGETDKGKLAHLVSSVFGADWKRGERYRHRNSPDLTGTVDKDPAAETGAPLRQPLCCRADANPGTDWRPEQLYV